ncbi:MAG TPA: MopE-related protein, partial [Polyangiaceae bacterium]
MLAGGGQGGEAGAGEGGVAGGSGAAGEAGVPSLAGTAGAWGSGGTSGNGGTSGSGGEAGSSGGSGGDGGTGAFDRMGCVVASDCDTKVGPLGCGEWACSEGRCVERIRCTDEDGDGDGSGPDCACSGKTTDCDDHDPLTGDMATASCCNGGTRTCKAGRWNVCSGATGETCDGEDNDCNGVVDDLGTFSCGLGACRNTVTACTGGALAACVPNPPLSASDGCNGIDDDCDGAVDEDCPECLHVAPDGDDGAAEESAGTLPFRTVQAALDYADAHRNGPNRVCVAAGAECGATAIYMAEPGTGFTMRDGISLLGNYESTTFTRCTNSTTRLRPGLDQSVVFPPGIRIQTVLDGFAIDRSYSANATGVSVTGASGAVLSNLAIVGAIDSLPIDSNVAYGVKLVDSSALIARSTIDGGRSRETYAVHATRSKVLIEENCSSPLDANGACTGDCTGSGPMLKATPAWQRN